MSTYNGFPHEMTGAHGAVGAQGPQGAMGPIGYPAGANGAAGPFSVSDARIHNNLAFHNAEGMVLKITHDGQVEWYGKPSQAALVLENTIGNLIDTRTASAGMRERTYLRACQSLLSKARSMSKEEFVSYLETSISNRNSKAVLLALEELSKLEETGE